MGATATGPVVIVTVAQHGCHALLLRAGRPVDVLALPGLTRADVLAAADRLRTVDHPDISPDRRRDLVDDLLDMLWRLVVRPVLDVLGPVGEVDRIHWCPTGPMTLLPLHAARARGDQPTHGSVLGSYAVALEPMLRPRRPVDVRPAAVLAVGVPHGWGPSTPLPAARREVARVTAARSGQGPVSELVGGAATRDALLTALLAHDEVHLACHVLQDPVDPAAAGFVLADGVVTIAQLVELNLPDGELAVLPGCGTAVGPARLLDEAVHVAAALQVAGFRHVVATLWSIPDAVGPRFAAAFHEALGAGTGPDRVHAAVCAAVAAVQERHRGHTDSWAPFVHFGT
jgi:CHAT domain-containing protein